MKVDQNNSESQLRICLIEGLQKEGTVLELVKENLDRKCGYEELERIL